MIVRYLFTGLLLTFGFSVSAPAFESKVVITPEGRATVCFVDPAVDDIKLFLNDGAGQRLRTLDAATKYAAANGERLVFAMNAGMFMVDGSPLGLFVCDGRRSGSLNLHSATGNFYWKPNGVFVLTGSNAAIVPSPDYPAIAARVTLATQSGPLLLIHGKMHPGFDPASPSRLIRNGVGIVSPHEIVFVIAETPMNFYEFASLFRDELHCRDALFLDGNVSSLYLAESGRDDEVAPLGPMIGVVQHIK